MTDTLSPRVAVIILGFNHREQLSDAIDSVQEQSYTNYQLFYIDNASSDDSADFVRTHYPTVVVTANEKNLGYAGGYDIAIRNAFEQNFDTAVLLNPDTVVNTEWLSELVRSAYIDPNIALAQSKILIWDNGKTDIINTFGNNIHFLGFGYCGHYKENDTFSEDIDIPYASGASLLIKKEYYPSKIHFDTDYFAYLEDQDLGWQARIQGLRIIASAESKVWHKYDFQKKHLSNFKFYLLERNRLFFLTKFFSFKFLFLIFPAFLIMEFGVLFDSIFKGYFLRKLKAEWDFMKALPRLIQKRKEIQNTRTLSDTELLHFMSPTISFEEVNSPLLRIANSFLKGYYACIKHLI